MIQSKHHSVISKTVSVVVTVTFFLLFQIVKLMKPIVSAASEVLGKDDVDEGECHY